MEKYSVLIIAGPSGVGKTAVAKAVIEKDARFTFLRSATTRKVRGDKHDDEYLYCTTDEFKALIDEGKMLEHMVYDGNMYGTPHSEVERAHKEGKIPLLVLDLNGVEALYHNPNISACAVYLYAEKDVIYSRLVGRDGKDMSRVESRLLRNREDYARLPSVAECFYAISANEGGLCECRDEVMEIYHSFEMGVPRKPDTDDAIAKIVRE